MISIKKIVEKQKERAARFPKDRIPFYSSSSSAVMDQRIFTAYANGELTKRQAMERMAKNNFLDEITELQFMTEYRALGYDRAYILNKELGIWETNR